MRSRHVGAEIRDQVPEVVFLAESDGAVGEEHELALARQVRARRDRCRSTRPCSPPLRARPAAVGSSAAMTGDPESQPLRRAVMNLLYYRFWHRSFLRPGRSPHASRRYPASRCSPHLRHRRPDPASGGPRQRADPAGQARRCDSVRVRRQQGAEAATRGRASAGRRRGHAHHVWRRAIESRARHGSGGRSSGDALRSRGQRRAACSARPPMRCSTAVRRRVRYVESPRGSRAGDGAGGRGGARRRAGGHS